MSYKRPRILETGAGDSPSVRRSEEGLSPVRLSPDTCWSSRLSRDQSEAHMVFLINPAETRLVFSILFCSGPMRRDAERTRRSSN